MELDVQCMCEYLDRLQWKSNFNFSSNYLQNWSIINGPFIGMDADRQKCIELLQLLHTQNYNAIEETYPAIVYIICTIPQNDLITYWKQRQSYHSGPIHRLRIETRNINKVLGNDHPIRRQFCALPIMHGRRLRNAIRVAWKSDTMQKNFCTYLNTVNPPLSETDRNLCTQLFELVKQKVSLLQYSVGLFAEIVYFVTAREIGYVSTKYDETLYLIGFTKNEQCELLQLMKGAHTVEHTDLQHHHLSSFNSLAKFAMEMIADKKIIMPMVHVVKRCQPLSGQSWQPFWEGKEMWHVTPNFV